MARRGGATGPVLAASPATRRVLRPRQAPGARGLPAGTTLPSAAPRTGGRVTRSSAALTQTNPSSSNDSQLAARTSRQSRSHKRSLSPGATVASPRRKRARRRPGSYREDSDPQTSDVENATSPRQSRARRTPKKQSPARAAKRRRLGSLAAETSALSLDSKPVIENTVIPDWASLPWHILVPIFQYAAADLEDSERAKWLSATSRVCRAFAEHALTALYKAPPLLSRAAAHNLVSLLSKDPSSTLFDYKQKVEALYIDVQEIASKTYKGKSLDLKTLICSLPRLKVIQFSHWKDEPPYRKLDDSLRWHYPAALFKALGGMHGRPAGEASGTHHPRLIGWQWNRRLMGPGLDLAGISALHQTPSFSSLKKVSFVNYQVPSLRAKQYSDDAGLDALDRAFVQGMADAISALPNLEFLSVESSTAINDQLLPLLPKRLTTLELVNCWEVNADDFANYLLSNGQKLRHLALHHNISLSLAFVTVLGTACPNLQSLSMDFKTFRHHEFWNDSEPNYSDLLTAGQIPDWPESLEMLELKNMRKWTAEAAETLFQSLVDSAPRLLKLRQLDLKAMLDIPYRQRSEIRDKWEAKLKKVFLRKSGDPRPLFSLRQPPAGFSQTGNGAAKGSSSRKSAEAAAMATKSPSRRSNRIASQLSNPSSRASSVGRDLRNGLGRPSYAEPDTDEDEDEDEDEEGEDELDPASGGSEASQVAGSPATEMAETAPFRHGMCEKVVIQLDNQKPAEKTWRMEDFMDHEEDDHWDADWDGQDEVFDDGRYAW
ncbi:F-box protein At-B [Madurella fahalii]|uniref:F-box protein At-B n=1 Tax=Madurella fahalii TaxID=1157608 RepID=A0ABQ0G5N9_9PEZI